VDFLDNQLTPSTGTIRMRALLDNAQRQFTPGFCPRTPAGQRGIQSHADRRQSGADRSGS
jgi:hypothetical protein